MLPWYHRTFRWMQANLTEDDPEKCKVSFWEQQWESHHIQGIIANAGGILAYYPSSNRFQERAKSPSNRDLFGEFVQAAKGRGMAVLARMDINRTTQAGFSLHPDWYAVDRNGSPYSGNDGRLITCINGGYYHTHVPDLLREILLRYEVDGFADNSWTGLDKSKICYCRNCRQRFYEEFHSELPNEADWDSLIYRKWFLWNVQLRTKIWDLFTATVKEAGGEDCLWLGMLNANPAHPYFCDLPLLAKRSPILLSDFQSREPQGDFEQNGFYGSVLASLAGEHTIFPESNAHYLRGERVFRLTANPAAESQLWMAEGLLGGVSPWLHFVGGTPYDRRGFTSSKGLMDWHKRNEANLTHREAVADVGLLWSQKNSWFYGRNDPHQRVELPLRGFRRALLHGRIPWKAVSLENFPDTATVSLMILPDLTVIDAQEEKQLEQFLKQGGSVLFTGATGFLDGEGELREQVVFDQLLRLKRDQKLPNFPKQSHWMEAGRHSYLKLPQMLPDFLKKFSETEILPFGGVVTGVQPDLSHQILAEYLPPIPVYPPEFSAFPALREHIPLIVAGDTGYGGRFVYLAGDVDRCGGETGNPDHIALLDALIQWLVPSPAYRVRGNGTLDCRLYRQGNRLLFHVVNLSGSSCQNNYLTEQFPIYDIQIEIQASPPHRVVNSQQEDLPWQYENGRITVTLPKLVLHDLIRIE